MYATHKGNFGEPGYDEITYDYNEDGLRTKKTRMYYNDTTGDIGYQATNYTLHGKNIVHLSDGGNELHFFYDAQNKPAMVLFNGTAYSYQYNLQGDVIGILDSNGTKVVSYIYDAWGNPISKTGSLASTLGTAQPFRYRGYVYDEETGLYYLRSRFYSPTYCRFKNTDNLMGYSTALFGHNIMVYCSNSPILYSDQNGHWPSYNPILNYELYKPFYSDLACLFLSAKGWSVTNELFQHGIWGGGKDFSTNKSGTNKLRQAIANSPDTKAFLGDHAKDMEPGSSKEISGGYEYKNGDLYFALQHVSYAGVITKDAAGNWSASITITDKFNFDAERLDWSSAEAFISSISLGNVANDGGLALQHLRILDPYKIVVDVTVYE